MPSGPCICAAWLPKLPGEQRQTLGRSPQLHPPPLPRTHCRFTAKMQPLVVTCSVYAGAFDVRGILLSRLLSRLSNTNHHRRHERRHVPVRVVLDLGLGVHESGADEELLRLPVLAREVVVEVGAVVLAVVGSGLVADAARAPLPISVVAQFPGGTDQRSARRAQRLRTVAELTVRPGYCYSE